MVRLGQGMHKAKVADKECPQETVRISTRLGLCFALLVCDSILWFDLIE
jgi:hypothetical protein